MRENIERNICAAHLGTNDLQPAVTFFQVLLALHFLKGAAPNIPSAATFFNLSKESYSRQLWSAIHLIRKSLVGVICSKSRFQPRPEDHCEFYGDHGVVSVADTTEITVQAPSGHSQEAKDFIHANWSGKARHVVIKFLVVVNIVRGDLCYCSRAYRGAAAGIQILRHSGIYAKARPSERFMGDRGFRGDPRTLAPKENPPRNVPYRLLSSADKFAVRLHRVRSIVERTIRRIKGVFPLFNQTWRYRKSRLSAAFQLAARFTQVQLSHQPVQRRRHPLLS